MSEKIVIDINDWNVITFLNKDWLSLYSWKTFKELVEEYWNQIRVFEKEEWMKIIDEINNSKYNIWKWERTTFDQYQQMLEILPPQNFQRGYIYWKTGWVKELYEIFRMSEYQTDDITSHFLEITNCWNKEYFLGNFRTNSYKNIKEIIDNVDFSKI